MTALAAALAGLAALAWLAPIRSPLARLSGRPGGPGCPDWPGGPGCPDWPGWPDWPGGQGSPGARPGRRAGPPAARGQPRRRTPLVLAGLALAGLLLAVPVGVATMGAAPIWPAVVLVGGGGVAGWTAHYRGARQRSRRAGNVAVACQSLAAELRAGAPPPRALAAVAAQWPDLLGVPAARAGLGADVPAALRDASEAPGAKALHAVAAAWQVCDRSGAGLAAVLHRVGEGLREEESVRREAQAHLAPVRTTARMLALLPLPTMLLGAGAGGAPLRFLATTPWGLACAAAGAVLAAAGIFWVERLAQAATRSAWDR